MRYFLLDENYNPNAWDNLVNALSNSKICDVENTSNGELIAHLKKHINKIDNDDLWPLYDAATDNERQELIDENHILELLERWNGDES